MSRSLEAPWGSFGCEERDVHSDREGRGGMGEQGREGWTGRGRVVRNGGGKERGSCCTYSMKSIVAEAKHCHNDVPVEKHNHILESFAPPYCF